MWHRFATALLLIGVMATAAGACTSDDTGDDEAVLPVIEVRHAGGTIRAEVAQQVEERTRGLGGRESLGRDRGMLFEFEETRNTVIWMKDMRFAIDIVWIGEDQRILDITENAAPQPGAPDGDLRRYPSPERVRYVLELNSGAASRLGLGAGDELEFAVPARPE